MKFIIKRETIDNSIHVDKDGNELHNGWEHESHAMNEDEYPAWYYIAYDKRPPIENWFGPLEYVEKIRNLKGQWATENEPDNFIKEGFWIIDIASFEQLERLVRNCYANAIQITSFCPELPEYMLLTIKDGDYYD